MNADHHNFRVTRTVARSDAPRLVGLLQELGYPVDEAQLSDRLKRLIDAKPMLHGLQRIVMAKQ